MQAHPVDHQVVAGFERAAGHHGATGIQQVIAVGASEAHAEALSIPATVAVAGDVGQHGAAGIAGAGLAIHMSVAGDDAHENLTAGQGVLHVGVRADFHLALVLVAVIDDPAIDLTEGRAAIVGATE
ncbi:hypothetical protein D3C71_1458930 [compost metagenome]